MNLQQSMLAAAPMTGLDLHMLIVLVIMLLTGVLGGAANYFLRDREIDASDWPRYPLLGVVAALTVPLFLNMISSSLIDGARVRPGDYFVLAGFCLLYVVASRRLAENVANRLLGQLDLVKRDLGQLKKAAHDGAAHAHAHAHAHAAAAAAAARPNEAVVESLVPRVELLREALGYNDIEILRALAEENTVCGNLAALADKTGIGRELVSQRLTVLKNNGIIETRINERNVLHWVVSPRGRQTLAEILAGQEEKKTA